MLGHIIVSLLGTSSLPSQPPLPPGSRSLSPLQGWAGDLDLGRVGSGGGLWPSWARLGASPEPGEGAPGFPEPGRAAIYSAGNLAGLFQASQVPKESRLQAERGGPQAPPLILFPTKFLASSPCSQAPTLAQPGMKHFTAPFSLLLGSPSSPHMAEQRARTLMG